jgi:hypothetical protein
MDSEEVRRALWRRGYEIIEECPIERVILPREKEFLDEYYQKLFNYRFRRFLGDLLLFKKDNYIDCETLFSRWKKDEVEEHWNFLSKTHIIENFEDQYLFYYYHLDNLGETLEWFISEILKKEFYMPTIWGVKIKEIKGGGDFDILSILENNLLYVECKSSPPNNIRLREIWEFLRRREVLKPKITIFFIDTTLKIERNIIENIYSLLKKRFMKSKEINIFTLKEGVYTFDDGIYIMQSKGDIIRNFQMIFRHFLDG